jgi:chromosome segregation and condensation protein ScpB
LVVIAFHQPITRPEIEAVRGVSLSQATMELLLETGLITAHGRKQAPGTPTLWVTTQLFLAQFGLKSLRDLPGSDVMMAISPARERRPPSRSAEGTPPADGAAADRPSSDPAPD